MPDAHPLEDILHKLVEPKDWAEFEAVDDGHLSITDEEVDPFTYDFYMRVGLHMKQPMQVIVACGRFIRMRKADGYKGLELRDINPRKPDDCFYITDTSPLSAYQLYAAQSVTMRPYKRWEPRPVQLTGYGQAGQGMIQPFVGTQGGIQGLVGAVPNAAGNYPYQYPNQFPTTTFQQPTWTSTITTTSPSTGGVGLGYSPILPGIK